MSHFHMNHYTTNTQQVVKPQMNAFTFPIKDRFDNVIGKKKPELQHSGLIENPPSPTKDLENNTEFYVDPIVSDDADLCNKKGSYIKNSGYFVMPKSVFFDPRFQGARLKYQKVLITILANAAYAPTTHAVGSKLIPIAIGQLCISERRLVELCNEGVSFQEDKVDKNVVHRAVQFWSTCQIVRQEVIHGKTLLTITISGFYEQQKNISEPQSESKVNHDRTTKVINKEDKEYISPISISLSSSESKSLKSDSAIASSESKSQEKTSRKRKSVSPSPQIERDKGVFTTDLEHQKLISSRGGELEVLKIYSEIATWKDRVGKSGGNDYTLAKGWQIKANQTQIKGKNHGTGNEFHSSNQRNLGIGNNAPKSGFYIGNRRVQ